jgi:hypothetical protein
MVPFGGNEERASMRTDVLEVSPPSRVLPAGGLESVVVGQKRHRTNEDHGDVTNGEAKQPRSDAEVITMNTVIASPSHTRSSLVPHLDQLFLRQNSQCLPFV